jgi:hypothetical protein
MNAKLEAATGRLEELYWDCHRNGGPDHEVLCILRLCEAAAKEIESLERVAAGCEE